MNQNNYLAYQVNNGYLDFTTTQFQTQASIYLLSLSNQNFATKVTALRFGPASKKMDFYIDGADTPNTARFEFGQSLIYVPQMIGQEFMRYLTNPMDNPKQFQKIDREHFKV